MNQEELKASIKTAWNNTQKLKWSINHDIIKSSDINFDLVNDEMKNYNVHDLSKVGYPYEFLNNIRNGDHVSSYAILGEIKRLFNIKTRSYIGHGSSHAELYFKIKGVLEN